MLVSEKVRQRLIYDPYENVRDRHINLFRAGTGIGKSFAMYDFFLPELIKEGYRKIEIIMPILDSAIAQYDKSKDWRRILELKFPELNIEFYGRDSTENKPSISAYVSSDIEEVSIIILNDMGLLNGKTSGIMNATIMEDYKQRLPRNYCALLRDEASFGGSPSHETYYGDTGAPAKRKDRRTGEETILYKARISSYCANHALNHGRVLAVTATFLHSFMDKFFNCDKSDLSPELQDIFNICTQEQDYATPKELGNILSSLNKAILVPSSKKLDEMDECTKEIISKTVQLTEDRYLYGIRTVEKLTSSGAFKEIKFDPRQVSMLVSTGDTWAGKKKSAKGVHIPNYLTIQFTRELLKSKDYINPEKYIFLVATKDGVYLENLNNTNHIPVGHLNIEKLLNGDFPQYQDVRYLFTIEMLKMSADIARLNVHATFRDRDGQMIKDDDGNLIPLFVVIIQHWGRVCRPFFGIDLPYTYHHGEYEGKDMGSCQLFDKNWNPEQVLNTIIQTFQNDCEYDNLQKDYNLLLEYMRIMNSHDLIMPKTEQYEKNLVEWQTRYVSTLSNDSQFDTGIFKPSFEEICEFCNGTGKKLSSTTLSSNILTKNILTNSDKISLNKQFNINSPNPDLLN
jgi:hypothetical protein